MTHVSKDPDIYCCWSSVHGRREPSPAAGGGEAPSGSFGLPVDGRARLATRIWPCPSSLIGAPPGETSPEPLLTTVPGPKK